MDASFQKRAARRADDSQYIFPDLAEGNGVSGSPQPTNPYLTRFDELRAELTAWAEQNLEKSYASSRDKALKTLGLETIRVEITNALKPLNLIRHVLEIVVVERFKGIEPDKLDESKTSRLNETDLHRGASTRMLWESVPSLKESDPFGQYLTEIEAGINEISNFCADTILRIAEQCLPTLRYEEATRAKAALTALIQTTTEFLSEEAQRLPELLLSGPLTALAEKNWWKEPKNGGTDHVASLLAVLDSEFEQARKIVESPELVRLQAQAMQGVRIFIDYLRATQELSQKERRRDRFIEDLGSIGSAFISGTAQYIKDTHFHPNRDALWRPLTISWMVLRPLYDELSGE